MEKHKIIRTVCILCLLLPAVIFISCDDDDDDNSSAQTELLSFGPSGVLHGQEIKFIGRNLDKVTSIVFAPSVEIPSTEFTTVTKEIITVVIPDEVETGRVILKTPEGDIQSKSVFSLEVPVTITSVPAGSKPGLNITVTGDRINWIESVVFTRDVIVEKSAFISQSRTELVLTVPMEAQTGFVTFNTGGTEPLAIESEDLFVVTLPVGEVTTPSLRHTEELTIVGTDLDLVDQVNFPGGASVLKGDFVSGTETEIVVQVPVTAKDGVVSMTVASGVKVAASNELSIILPVVTAFSPSDPIDQQPGVTLTITGTDMDYVKTLTFPNVETPVETFLSQSPTEIQVVIPDDAEGGTLVITTIHGFAVPVAVPFGDQLKLATVIFDDAVHAPLKAGGGWGGATTDAANTEKTRAGTVSVKVTFGGDWGGGAQFGNWDGLVLSTTGASYYAFSIYGGTGTGGKNINANVAGKVVEVTVEEGKWKDVQIPLADFDSPTGINEVWFQDRGWSGTVYIDQIGLK